MQLCAGVCLNALAQTRVIAAMFSEMEEYKPHRRGDAIHSMGLQWNNSNDRRKLHRATRKVKPDHLREKEMYYYLFLQKLMCALKQAMA